MSVLDAWPRGVVGYAIGRSMGARLTAAALKAAIASRQPSPVCIHRGVHGSQYASAHDRALLAEDALRGSVNRRDNLYDNATVGQRRSSSSLEPGRRGYDTQDGRST